MLGANPGGGSASEPAGKKRTSRMNRQPISGILARADRCPPVVPDASAHLFQARRPVGLAEQLPCFRQAHGSEVAVEPAADYPVVRIVGLEEERLTDGEGMKSTPAARAPEVDFREVGPGRQEVIPVIVGHPDVTPHTGIMHSVSERVPTYRCVPATMVRRKSTAQFREGSAKPRVLAQRS